MGPFPHPDGHDFPRSVDEVVPGVAAEGDDVVIGLEDAVREPVVAHELPDVLDRVQLRRSGRQRKQGDVGRDGEFGGHVPSGLIEHQHGMGAGIDGRADLGQVGGHRRGVAPGHDQPGALALLRTDRAEDVRPFGALVMRGARPRAAFRPAAGDGVLLPDARFVLPPQLYLGSGREAFADRVQFGRKSFF